MIINKFKKSGRGLYKIELADGREMSLYEEVILKYNLLLKKEIIDSEINDINSCNLEYEVYYYALNNIKARFKSTYELRTLLERKKYPDNLIDMAIDKLLKQGYLNDKEFTRSYINNQMITTSKGPLKIVSELLDKKVDSSIIYSLIDVFSEEEQKNKIKKLIDKKIKSNHSRGGYALKNKIFNDIKLLGYDSGIINNVINEFDFNSDSDIAKKEYEKLYKRLSRKYSGSELENKIRERLYQKGLVYEE